MRVVTIGIPVYKRLTSLSKAVRSIAEQEYPHIQLLVSDNGNNGSKVKDIVRQTYGRPFAFRQNDVSVDMITHYNQLVSGATGHYFILLNDDDWISSNFVSDLIAILERDSHIALATARQEVLDTSGKLHARSSSEIAPVSAGEDFVKWLDPVYGFLNYNTFLARTEELRDCGGFPNFTTGFHSELSLIVKLSLNRMVAHSQRSVYYVCKDEGSISHNLSYQVLAEATRQFLHFLDSDPWIVSRAKECPVRWDKLQAHLVRMAWSTYVYKWATIYRDQLSFVRWAKAGFALPFRIEYYLAIGSGIREALRYTIIWYAKRWMPAFFNAYRWLRYSKDRNRERHTRIV